MSFAERGMLLLGCVAVVAIAILALVVRRLSGERERLQEILSDKIYLSDELKKAQKEIAMKEHSNKRLVEAIRQDATGWPANIETEIPSKPQEPYTPEFDQMEYSSCGGGCSYDTCTGRGGEYCSLDPGRVVVSGDKAEWDSYRERLTEWNKNYGDEFVELQELYRLFSQYRLVNEKTDIRSVKNETASTLSNTTSGLKGTPPLSLSKQKLEGIVRSFTGTDDEGFSQIDSIEFMGTLPGIRETCGGCTLGDGQDCVLPVHYVDEYRVVTSGKQETYRQRVKKHIRYSILSVGYSDGECSNAFGDYVYLHHYKYMVDECVYAVSQYHNNG